MTIASMLNKIVSNDSEGAVDVFVEVLNQKVLESLENMRVEIAKDMFKESMYSDSKKAKEDEDENEDSQDDSDEKSDDDKDGDSDEKVKTKKDGKKVTITVDEETEPLDEISGATLGSYVQKARKQDADKRAHAAELDADPKVQALKQKRSDYYNRREYTRTGASKHRAAIDKTIRDESARKQKLDPNYPESITPTRMHGIEKAIKKLQYGTMTNEDVAPLDEAEFDRTEFGGSVGKYWKTAGEVHGTQKVKGRGYGNQYDTDEDGEELNKTHAQPEVKRGRGRPKKDAVLGGTSKFDSSGIADLLKAKMGPLPKAKSRKIVSEK